MVEYDNDFKTRTRTIVISTASAPTTTSLINSAQLLAYAEATVDFSPPIIFDPFDWGIQDERQGTPRAVGHLLVQLKKFGVPLHSETESQAKNYQTVGYDLLDVSNEHGLLDIETENFKISGGSDAVIVPSRMRFFKHQQICCVFEFKTEIPIATAAFPNQLILEAVAAQMKSKQPILAVETDLHSTHAFGVFFQMGEGNIISLNSVRYASLAAMAHHVSQFLTTYCEPRVVGGLSKRTRSDNAGSGGGGASEGGGSGGDEDVCDGDNGGNGGDSKRSTQLMVKIMNERARGNLSLAQEHFNDHIDDTEPLSEERAVMVDHLFQSYGYTIPSYQFAQKTH
jgi:hypothetical protein